MGKFFLSILLLALVIPAWGTSTFTTAPLREPSPLTEEQLKIASKEADTLQVWFKKESDKALKKEADDKSRRERKLLQRQKKK